MANLPHPELHQHCGDKVEAKQGNFKDFFKLIALIIPLLLSACRGQTSGKPPIFNWNLNMDQQRRFEGQERNHFFTDNSSMRQPVKGTVARRQHLRIFRVMYPEMDKDSLSEREFNKAFYEGRNADSSLVKHNPVQITKKFLLRGQNRFNVYCTPCHGYAGDGKGIVMTGHFGFVPAPSYHQARLRNAPDGHIYDVIANGIRSMPSYAHQIPVRDRWAIVAYVRALQRSQDVPESELKKQNVDLAALKKKAKQKHQKEAAQKKAKKKANSGKKITAAMGKKIRQQNACNTCHSIDGSAGTGPTWKGLYGSKVELKSGKTVIADDAYITESIVNSTAKITKGFQPVMPNFSYLSTYQVKSLIAYIKTLSNKTVKSDSSGSKKQ